MILLKNRDRTCGQKELHRGHEEWPIIYFQVGRGLRIASAPKEFGKQDFQDLEGASYCWENVIYYRLIKPES